MPDQSLFPVSTDLIDEIPEKFNSNIDALTRLANRFGTFIQTDTNQKPSFRAKHVELQIHGN